MCAYYFLTFAIIFELVLVHVTVLFKFYLIRDFSRFHAFLSLNNVLQVNYDDKNNSDELMIRRVPVSLGLENTNNSLY